MSRELPQQSLFSQEYLFDIVQKYLKPLPLAVFSSSGHTVAPTSEQVDTEAAVPFIRPEEEPLLSPFSQSQPDVLTAAVTGKRQREQQRESKQEQEFCIIT